ncbi:MAG: acylphosphatase [Candidatus Levyibacteriota bacterium]
MKQVRVVISGTVQGVSFRYFLQEQANILHVTGWARNTQDGNVEALFQGDENAVGRMIRRCFRGPTSATVAHVTFDEANEPIYQDFVVKN